MKNMILIFFLLCALFSFEACTQQKTETGPADPGSGSADTGEGRSVEGMDGERLYSSWDEVPENDYGQQTMTVNHNGQTIWGIAYIPQTNTDKYPLVICSHGLGGDYSSCLEYAELFASHGIAVYCFDFRGGGGSHSDGKITEMSLITEAEDILTIIDTAKSWDFVDPEHIVLLGKSQGGAVSAIAAARNTEDVNGLILCFPALLVHDAIHEQFDSLDEVPDRFFFKWVFVGRPYAADVWDYDIYSEIGNYSKPVLLLHGEKDKAVPVSYSDRAAEIYREVSYYIIKGAGHGFEGEETETANTYILGYLQDIGIL